MIEFRDVNLRYHYDEFALLKGANFTLRDGLNSVLCDTQSGKSSICKLLIKEVAATGGQIFIEGLPISSITSADLGILYLPSAPAFFENRSVRFNVEYPLKVRKVGKPQRSQRAEAAAKLVGLDCLDEKVKKLDGKTRQLVALARGLTVERKVVLFDDFFEIDSDQESALARVGSVTELFENATCVILSSDKRLAMGNTVVIDGGVAVYQGDAEQAQRVIDGLGWIAESIRSK